MSLEEIKKDLEFIADKVNYCKDIEINKKISIFLSIQETINKLEKAIKAKDKKTTRDGNEDFQMVY